MESDKSQSSNEMDLNSNPNKRVVHSETLRTACSQLLDMYIDEEYFNMGRQTGELLLRGQLGGILNEVPDEDQSVDTPEVDIFGNPLSEKQKQLKCDCPICHRRMAASGYATHLRKCMGISSYSFRTPSRRNASSNSRKNSNNSKHASGDSNNKASSSSCATGPTQIPVDFQSENLGSDDHLKENGDPSLAKRKQEKK